MWVFCYAGVNVDNKNRRKKEEKTTTDSERQCPGMGYKYKLGLQLSPWIDIHKKTFQGNACTKIC